MSVCGRVAFGGSDATTMATAEPEGNRRPGLFPRLLLKLPRLLLRLPRLLLRLPRLLPRFPRCPCCGWQKTLGRIVLARAHQPETIGAIKQCESVSSSAAI